MLNLKEIMDKTQLQRKAILECLDQGFYHPEHVTKEQVPASIYYGLKPADQAEIKETLDTLSLAELLGKTSTVTGSTYLVAAKLHDTLIYVARQDDICPLIGYVTSKWEGGDLTVQIAKDGTYVPRPFASGAKIPELNVQLVQATLSPVAYGIPILAGEDLIEDEQYGIVQWHVEKAARACGKQSSDLALAVLKGGADGDGILNSITTATLDTTIAAEILHALDDLGEDQMIGNTMVITPEAWEHTVGTQEIAGGAAGDVSAHLTTFKPPAPDYNLTYSGLDTLFNASPQLHDSADAEGAAFTTCVTLVFDRNNSILTGRKRWLEIKDYSDPVEDIAGAVVSYRQDSVTLYKDAICVITEATQ